MGIAQRWERFEKLPADIKQKLAQLVPLFKQEGVLLAYLFGSLAQGRQPQDVDLALLTRTAPAFRLRQTIADCLGAERVDLVDLRDASPVLRFEIVRTGQLLFAADETVCEQFELATLHLYRDTIPLRRQQEAYLRERIGLWLSKKKALSSV